VHAGKTLTDLQILGCELHQNSFGGRAPLGPDGGVIALPSRYWGREQGKEVAGNREGKGR